MCRIQLKATGLRETLVLCIVLFGMIAPTASSIILTKIASQASESSIVASKNSSSLSATSSYYGQLLSSDSKFVRPGGSSSSSSYYYNSIRLNTDTSGSYSFRGSSSSFSPYGCLYSGSFNPNNPSQNQLVCAGGTITGEFAFTQYLAYSTTYTLVVTSYSPYGTGSYTVTATGPGIVNYTWYIPDIYNLAVGIIVAIVIGSILCFALCVGLIVAVCVCLCRQQTVVHQTIVPAQYNPHAQTVYYPDIHGNVGQVPPPSYKNY